MAKSKTTKQKTSNLPDPKTCPPAILPVIDLANRFPDRTKDIVDHEIKRRDHELLRIEEFKTLLAGQPWDFLRTLILSGAITFFIAWFLSILAELGRLYEGVASVTQIRIPLFEEDVVDLTALVPESTLTIFADLPNFGALESLLFALAIVLLLALVKLTFILLNWKKIRKLKDVELEVVAERRMLRSWRDALTKRKK